MANSLQMNLANPVSGLGTFQYTVLTAGPVTVECKSTLPWSPAGSAQQSSNVSIVIKQNASALVTVGGDVKDPTPTQGSIGAATSFQAAVNDVISVVLASSNAIDSIPNNVKSTINLFQGIGD